MYLAKYDAQIKKFNAKAQEIHQNSGMLEQLKYLDVFSSTYKAYFLDFS